MSFFSFIGFSVLVFSFVGILCLVFLSLCCNWVLLLMGIFAVNGVFAGLELVILEVINSMHHIQLGLSF